MSINSLKSLIIKSNMSTWNAKTNVTKIGKGQTVDYRGFDLSVTWGGEYYTAFYKNMEFRNESLKFLKQEIRNGWSL